MDTPLIHSLSTNFVDLAVVFPKSRRVIKNYIRILVIVEGVSTPVMAE